MKPKIPEGQSLGLLNQLLVWRIGLHPHHDRSLLRIDLGIQLSIPGGKCLVVSIEEDKYLSVIETKL